jgi:hypothetical protein
MRITHTLISSHLLFFLAGWLPLIPDVRYTSFYLSFRLSVRLLSACLPICLSVRLSVCLSAYLSVCLPLCPPICLSVWPSVRLSVCVSTYLPVCLPVCLSVRLPVCLPAWDYRRLPDQQLCPSINITNTRLWNCGIAVADQHSIKSCGIVIAKVLLSSCWIAVADQKKSCACPPLQIIDMCNSSTHMTRRHTKIMTTPKFTDYMNYGHTRLVKHLLVMGTKSNIENLLLRVMIPRGPWDQISGGLRPCWIWSAGSLDLANPFKCKEDPSQKAVSHAVVFKVATHRRSFHV